jgi:phosphatidylinositol glycan class S
MARQALHSAETAFFDKTMVSLLYFPSEHIFAMYMPFFVPSAIPIIAAIVEQVKLWKAARKLKVS